ncbi:carbohydrate-binding protein [Methylobacter sp. S3L5C]|uniref:carbohydrate-binding protein n=1 Tax=Methylobacter sp. S3L5C TaxID=2839024 RepID=UPI001FADDAB6|nr:carbohydrate-binding protein [Methylobacter sp. S3L5C]UOA08739.1 carbohydrate-binding protein [Methylobacter sp. S3L5C]
MRKTQIDQPVENIIHTDVVYLDLKHLAQVEISSECREHPIESALVDGPSSGWEAASPGEQIIRLIFDQPQVIKQIVLSFDETEMSRTQEFVLLWRMDNDDFFREILRQQYNFSQPLTTQEIENITVDLKQVKALELRIIPDISGGEAWAKLTHLRISAT